MRSDPRMLFLLFNQITRIKTVKNLVLPLMALCVFLTTAFAGTSAHAGDYDKISLSVGYFDVFDDEDALDMRAEYRWDSPLIWQIKPFAALEYTTDGSGWIGAGVYYDHHFGNGFVITPSFAPGLYNDGGGKDLGHVIEFRSQIEVGYEFENASRVSVGLSHLSNASLDDHNPGTEVLSLYYHMPVGMLFP